jgi:glycosyltransferase involved in cell wall biosynthesis
MNAAPLVSVIVPTHNRPEMLAEALASVRAQTFTDYEIIVVSNGELPRTAAASQKVAVLAGARWFVLADGNVSAARNFGIERTKGEWIAFLDDDDLWLPDKLERQMKALEITGADMIACDYVESYRDGSKVLQRPRLLPGVSYLEGLNHLQWWAATPSVVVRRSVVQAVNGFDVRLYYGEDVDLWRRIA